MLTCNSSTILLQLKFLGILKISSENGPHFWIFGCWQFLPAIPALLVVAFFLILKAIQYCCPNQKCSAELQSSDWIKSVGRNLCLWMFRSLFTSARMKNEAQDSRTSSPYMALKFLNRKVEDNSWIVYFFYFICFATLAASALAFLSSIPLVTTESDCLEKDSRGHPLYCYKNEDNYPVDCTTPTNQKGTKDKYTCYAWTQDIFSIAFAAALAISTSTVAFLTFCIRLGEMYLKLFKNVKCCNKACKYIWTVILAICAIFSFCLTICNLIDVFITECSCSYTQCIVQFLTVVNKFVEYQALPMWVFVGLIIITWNLEEYCEQEGHIPVPYQQLLPQVNCPNHLQFLANYFFTEVNGRHIHTRSFYIRSEVNGQWSDLQVLIHQFQLIQNRLAIDQARDHQIHHDQNDHPR